MELSQKHTEKRMQNATNSQRKEFMFSRGRELMTSNLAIREKEGFIGG